MIYQAEGCSPPLKHRNGKPADPVLINKSNKSMHMSQAFVNSIIYSFLGIGILTVTFILFEVLTPKHNLRKEILEQKNVALAILAGFFMVAVAIIIASAIH